MADTWWHLSKALRRGLCTESRRRGFLRTSALRRSTNFAFTEFSEVASLGLHTSGHFCPRGPLRGFAPQLCAVRTQPPAPRLLLSLSPRGFTLTPRRGTGFLRATGDDRHHEDGLYRSARRGQEHPGKEGGKIPALPQPQPLVLLWRPGEGGGRGLHRSRARDGRLPQARREDARRDAPSPLAAPPEALRGLHAGQLPGHHLAGP